MKWHAAIFAMRMILCLLVGLEVFLGVTTGSALSWASAAFIAAMLLSGDWTVR